MRICSHLEAQPACHEGDDVLGVRVFSHLEVINTNRTTCTEANGSQVCEYARTWKRNLYCHQVDDVLGVRVFSHLEVIKWNKTVELFRTNGN